VGGDCNDARTAAPPKEGGGCREPARRSKAVDMEFIQGGEGNTPGQRVEAFNEDGFGADTPFQVIQDGSEGIRENVVIVDEFAIGTTRPIGDPPTEGFGGTREDLTDAMAVLEADLIGGMGVMETTAFDNREIAPTDLRFLLGGKFDRGDAGGEGTVEQSPETFAHAGRVDDDVLGRPLLGEVLDLTKNRGMILAGPGMAGEDAVGGMVEFGKSGKVDGDDGEGGGVTPGVAETFAGEGGGKGGFGFVHAGDVEEECDWKPLIFPFFGPAHRRLMSSMWRRGG